MILFLQKVSELVMTFLRKSFVFLEQAVWCTMTNEINKFVKNKEEEEIK